MTKKIPKNYFKYQHLGISERFIEDSSSFQKVISIIFLSNKAYMENFSLSNIRITDDPDFLNKENNVTPHIAAILEPIYEDLLKEKKSVLKKLLKYTVKYPKVPLFKNYLTAYYISQGEMEKAFECNQRLLKEHPNHFYGIINLGTQFLEKGDFESLLKLIGENFDIHDAIPSRDLFYLDEVVSFYIIVIGYLFGVDRNEEAELITDLLYELDGDNPKLESIQSMRMDILFKKTVERILKDEEEEFSQTVNVEYTKTNLNTKPPSFHNPQFMELLYCNGITDYQNILEALPNVSEETLGEDLIACIRDSIDRYEFFQEAEANGDLNEDSLHFPIHTFVLMAGLKIPNALEVIFDFLRQEDEFLDFWLYDLMDDILHSPIVEYGKNNLKTCFEFLHEPGIYTYNRITVSGAILPLAVEYPEMRTEIIEHSRKLLNFYIAHFNDPKIGDIEFIGLLISELVDIKAVELIEEITLLFEKGYVAVWICGTLKDVLKDIRSNTRFPMHWEVFKDSESHYEHLFPYFDDIKSFAPPTSHTNNYYDSKPIIAPPKIGRNEPCPCGSGKKYKKCCLNK